MTRTPVAQGPVPFVTGPWPRVYPGDRGQEGGRALRAGL